MRKVIMTAPKTIEVHNDAPAPKAEDLKGNEILLKRNVNNDKMGDLRTERELKSPIYRNLNLS